MVTNIVEMQRKCIDCEIMLPIKDFQQTKSNSDYRRKKLHLLFYFG